MKYQTFDRVAWRAARRAEIVAGRPVVANERCHYCGWTLGRGALWCSAICAEDYAEESAAVAKESAG